MRFVPRFLQQLSAIVANLKRDLLRAHKDPRARRGLAQIMLPLLFLIAFTIYVIVNGITSVVAIGVDVVLFALVVWYRKRNPVEQSGPVTLDLTPRTDIEDTPVLEASPELLRELQELALLHAILAQRAASEAFLRHKGVPEGKQIITRQKHIRILRELDLYDRLGRTERDLILLPDGAWGEGTIDRTSMLLEPLRVLRWLLGIDALLPMIGEARLVDFSLANSLLENPDRLFTGHTVTGIEPIRSARSSAETIFYRCYTEAHRRGFALNSSAEEADAAIFYAQRLAGREDEDIVIGNIIVSRASDEEVRLAAGAATARIQLLRWVQERLYGTQAARPTLTVFALG